MNVFLLLKNLRPCHFPYIFKDQENALPFTCFLRVLKFRVDCYIYLLIIHSNMSSFQDILKKVQTILLIWRLDFSSWSVKCYVIMNVCGGNHNQLVNFFFSTQQFIFLLRLTDVPEVFKQKMLYNFILVLISLLKPLLYILYDLFFILFFFMELFQFTTITTDCGQFY